ncbi:MAG: hypothetical protein PHQ80_02200 [Candidatus ainarchaeum sp.]|nr:hypothetical protein [Candidatus ainarchaeum sp.]MDD5096501.1 hypothetical protein [Candidatus ainarchaeum sp.]
MSDFKNAIIEENTEEKASPKMRVRSPIDIEEAEIKRLKPEDAEEVTHIMRKCLFAVTEEEVREVLRRNMSYGAYVGRMLVAVGLAWGTAYNPTNLQLEAGYTNAIFLEDDAVLLAYEGKGLRELLVDHREMEGRAREFQFAVTLTTPMNPDGNVDEVVSQRGTKTEKVLMKAGYKFYKTRAGVIAVKQI